MNITEMNTADLLMDKMVRAYVKKYKLIEPKRYIAQN